MEAIGDTTKDALDMNAGYSTSCVSQYSTGVNKVVAHIGTGTFDEPLCTNPETYDRDAYFGITGLQNPFRRNKTGNSEHEQ